MALYLSQSDYSNIDPADIGKLENRGYGSLLGVSVHCIVSGATSVLSADITTASPSITVSDASRYPAAPFIIQIDSERLYVTGKAGGVFSVTRGYDNTEAAAHYAGQTVFEVKTEYVYKSNDLAMDGIDALYIDGIKQASGNYKFYTGKAGDSHPDWPDVGVIALPAAAYIGQQYNLESIAAAGEIKPGWVEFASSPHLSTVDKGALTPDTSGGLWSVTIGAKGTGTTNQAFVKFGADYGTIISQTYYIEVQNASVDNKTIDVDVLITEGSILKKSKSFSIPKNQSITLEVSRPGGIFEDVLRIHASGSDLIVKDMRKDVLINKETAPGAGNATTIQEAVIIDQLLTGGPVRFATYSDTALGSGIVKQTHAVELKDTSGNNEFLEITIMAVEKNGTLLSQKNATLKGSDTFYGSLTHSGGSYDTATIILINNLPVNAIENVKIKKIIEYVPTTSNAAGTPVATSSAKIVVGNTITVDGRFTVDTTGDYGGVGNLITRPDRVMKHYLVNEKGASLSDIDSTSFDAAGTLYDSASYTLNFLRSLSINEDQLAEETRSVVYVTKGKYYLDVILDSTPTPVRTIPEGDVIDAPGFTYDHGKFEELHTDYTARYGLNADGTWAGVVTAVDTGNIYGTRKLSIDLPLIKSAAMAQSVLNHILKQHKKLYGVVKFKTTWRHQSLNIGDTFTVQCSLYGGEKFFIEKKEILDDNTIYFEGRQWW